MAQFGALRAQVRIRRFERLSSGARMIKTRFWETFWGKAFALFAASTLAGLFFATQFYYVMKAWGTPVAWEWVLPVRLWAWYEWGLLFLVVIWLGKRFPLEAHRRKRTLPIHCVASVVISAFQIVVNTWTHLTFVEDPAKGYTYSGYLQSLLMFALHRNLLIYWIILGGYHAFRVHRALADERIAASELKAQLAGARLQALKMQLHPHFLFNTLHAIAALIRKNPAEADRVINDLSELLRLALADVESHKVPLAREMEFLERYLAIQEVRFGERLRIEFDVEPETLSALVPNLLLQPIVENAVRHAVASRHSGGLIEIRARRVGARLRIEVEDDGPGLLFSSDIAFRSGLGLSSTKERVERLYASEASIELGAAHLGGLAVRFDLPYESEPLVEVAPFARAKERSAA
jgi:hypothetical protein